MNTTETKNFADSEYGDKERIWARRRIRDLNTVEQIDMLTLSLETNTTRSTYVDEGFHFVSSTLASISQGNPIPQEVQSGVSEAFQRQQERPVTDVEKWADELASNFSKISD